MELTFEIEYYYNKKQNAAVLHHPDNVFQIYYEDEEENLMMIEAPTPYGDFSDLVFTEPKVVATGFNYHDLLIRRTQRDKFWFVWDFEGDIRIAPWPDDSPPYEVDDPYRLYYAVDTLKLYMNINQRWIFIGSPSHELLQKIGIHTHAEIDQALLAINNMEGQINSLEELYEVVDNVIVRVTSLEEGTVYDPEEPDPEPEPEPGPEGLDMNATYTILVYSNNFTDAAYINTEAMLQAKGHTVIGRLDNDASAIPAEVDIIATVRANTYTEALRTLIENYYNSGGNVLIGYDGDTGLGVSMGMASSLASSANTYNGYVAVIDHQVLGNIPAMQIDMTPSTEWARWVTGSYVGDALVYRDAAGNYPCVLAIDKNTTNLNAENMSYRTGFIGWLYGRSGYTIYGKAIIDRMIRWIIQGNAAGGE